MQLQKTQSDLKAGVVVFLVALPLCLGISLACGIPLLSGILSGIIGGLVVTTISSSVYSVSGPAAGLTAIVISSITQLGSIETFMFCVFLAGIFQVAMGVLKLGNISTYIPNAVIKGMLAGIGIILIIKQVPHMVGYDADPEGDLFFTQSDGQNSLTELTNMLNYISPGAICVAAVSLLILVISEQNFYKNDKWFSLVPAPLLVVVMGILLNISFRSSSIFAISQEHLVNLPSIGSFDELVSTMLKPNFSEWKNSQVWMIAGTIAMVASLETLLSLEAIEKLDPERQQTDANRELLAQGAGNLLCGLAGGLPVTSVIVRSSANIHAGAKTKLAIIVHSILLLLSILFIPGLLGLIPNASLAVILTYTGYKLAKYQLFKEQYRAGWDQFIPFLVTIIVMLRTDMLKGVGAGLLVAIIYIIRFNLKNTFETVEDEIEGRKTYLIKLPQHATFFSKGFITQYLSKIEDDSTIIIDGSINKSTDKDVKEVLLDFNQNALQRNIHIHLVKFKF